MHSAYIATASGWKWTRNVDEVIDHVGDVIINDTEEDKDLNLGLIEARTGKYATPLGNVVILAESKLQQYLDPKQLQPTEPVLVLRSPGNSFGILDEQANQSCPDVDMTGYVVDRVDNNDLAVASTFGYCVYRIRYDIEEWNRRVSNRTKTMCETHKASLRRKVCKGDFEEFVHEARVALGVGYPKAFILEQVELWLSAHDVVAGHRATNKIARDLALRWCNDRKKSIAWLRRWSNDEIAARVDKRLAAVLRLGNANSRHKKGV